MSSARPNPPPDLLSAGKKLWKSIVADLPEAVELDARELALLAHASRQADDIAALERALKRDGVTISGSAGQPRLNAALTELRQGRIALARLLGGLDIPEEEKTHTAASQRARRWKSPT